MLLSRCLLTWNCKLQIALSAVGLIKILRHESANLYGSDLSKPTLFDVTISGSDDFWQPAKINWDLRYGRENGDPPNRDNVIKSSPRDINAPGSFLSSRIDLLFAILCPQFLSPSEFYFSRCKGTILTEIIFSTFSKGRSTILIFLSVLFKFCERETSTAISEDLSRKSLCSAESFASWARRASYSRGTF